MNTYTTKAIADSSTFQKYERKRPSKRPLDTLSDEHGERYNKGNCVKQAWRMSRESKRSWGGEHDRSRRETNMVRRLP